MTSYPVPPSPATAGPRPSNVPKRAGTEPCDLLLTGGHVVTVDDQRRVIIDGAVAIRGERIVAVGTATELSRFTANRIVDCAGKAVIPGFIDGHNHLYQGLARGLGEGMAIVPWLVRFMWPYSITIGPDDALAGVRLGLLEAVRAGITTVVDNHYAPSDVGTTLAVADAIEQAGIRGAVARGIIGGRGEIAARRGQPAELFRFSPADELAITREAMQARPPGSTVAIWPAPLNLTYVEPALTRSTIALARDVGSRWHAHCCEGRSDPTAYLQTFGARPVRWLASEELLDKHATLAHGVWLDDDDVRLAGAAGAGIAHNPGSNGYLASGTIRLRDLDEAGAALALGTDGPSCGHRQDMFEQMKLALLAQRFASLDAASVRAEQVFELATRRGAEYVGVDAGVLAPGRLADVVVVDLDRPHLRPLHRVVATLVYCAQPGDIVMTIARGRVIVQDGRCLTLDEPAVLAEAQRRADLLVDRAGMADLRSEWPARSGPA